MRMNERKELHLQLLFLVLRTEYLLLLCHLRRHSHPHQSKTGSEEPIFDSFSLKGEAMGANFRKV